MSFFTNLDVYQGADFSQTFVYKDVNRLVVNITGYTIKASMRKEYSSSAQTRFTSSIQSASEGKIKIQLSSTQTSALTAGRYVYDILLLDASSPQSYIRAFEGQITVHPQVTNIDDFDSPNSP